MGGCFLRKVVANEYVNADFFHGLYQLGLVGLGRHNTHRTADFAAGPPPDR
jgi:hypothetical protein